MLIPLLFLAALILLLWKWLDIRSVRDLTNIARLLRSDNGQHFFSNLFQVDENSKRHGGELVASVLKSHDVKEIFVLCGGHISPILVAAESLGIKIIDTRHEVNDLIFEILKMWEHMIKICKPEL
ncbi:unnamed protein product [Cylicostephanus goldi]|uniref:Thiamine pyrophosphate enzyme N-terminal TPP-binding domain-containing protein n=1 Tax=Cylicostephanus goldi TaxID=71465 RepID=A0A3P6RD31_CYLGO|nr:unnamed protein product [Cylicostephanus goldi]